MSTVGPRAHPLAMTAALAALYLFWGGSFLAIRLIVDTMPPFYMAALRFTTAGVALLLILRARGVPWPPLSAWRPALGIGALMIAGTYAGVFWAETRVDSGVASLIMTTIPIWSLLLGWWHPRARLADDGPRDHAGPSTWVALLGGSIGVALLVWPTSGSVPPIELAGGLALLGSAIAWSWGTWEMRGRLEALPILQRTAMFMMTGGLLLALLSIVVGESWPPLSEIPAIAWWGQGYLIVCSSLITYPTYLWLLRYAAPARASSYAYVNPVVALVAGHLVLNEPIGLRTLVASVVIIGAVALLMARPRTAKESEPDGPDEPPERHAAAETSEPAASPSGSAPS